MFVQFIERTLERRHTADVLKVDEHVRSEGVDNMVDEVLDRAFTGHDGLRTAAEARHHGEATVLDLLELHRIHVFLAIPHRVESSAGVRRFTAAAQLLFPAVSQI